MKLAQKLPNEICGWLVRPNPSHPCGQRGGADKSYGWVVEYQWIELHERIIFLFMVGVGGIGSERYIMHCIQRDSSFMLQKKKSRVSMMSLTGAVASICVVLSLNEGGSSFATRSPKV